MVYRDRRPDGTTRLTGAGGSGTPGPPGDPGPEGPEGTRWGETSSWHFADHINEPCTMFDGGEPRVGDLLISTNSFGLGDIYEITAVYPTTNNVDFDYVTNIRGAQGTTGAAGPLPDTLGSSTSNITIGTGSKTFALSPAMNKAFDVGATVTAQYTSIPGNYMVGVVTAATTTSVTLNVTHIGGSGTFSAWALVLSGKKGEKGDQGDPGPPGGVLDAWPINAVYISFDNVDPSTLFGGTWSSIGSGRVLIGVDPGDAAMDAAGDTGGSKTVALPAHVHSDGTLATNSVNHTGTTNTSTGGSGTRVNTIAGTNDGSHSHDVTGATGNPTTTPTMDNLPPYLAVYMWRRTA